MVSAHYATGRINQVDEVMCQLKKHLYKLALRFNQILGNTKYHGVLYNGCTEKDSRFLENTQIREYLEKHPEINYNEVKYNLEKYLGKENKQWRIK